MRVITKRERQGLKVYIGFDADEEITEHHSFSGKHRGLGVAGPVQPCLLDGALSCSKSFHGVARLYFSFFDFGIDIKKDSEEYNAFSAKLNKVEVTDKPTWLTQFMLQHMDRDTLVSFFLFIRNEGFESGVSHAQEQVRKTLGL